MSDFTIDFNCLKHVLPEIIWRYRWDQLAAAHGLPYKRSYMQNLDSLGVGPPRYYIGGRVAYKRMELIDWMNAQVAKIPASSDGVPGWIDR